MYMYLNDTMSEYIWNTALMSDQPDVRTAQRDL